MYVELFGRPKYDILADLITKANALTTPLQSAYLSFGKISGTTVPGTEDRVNIQVTGKSPVSGQKTFTYSRIDLGKLLSAATPTLVLPETASTVADLLPLIQVKYNVYIDAEDVANAASTIPYIPAGTTLVITIQTLATLGANSPVWSGNLDIVCSGGSLVPSGALLTESGNPITTEDNNYLTVEQS